MVLYNFGTFHLMHTELLNFSINLPFNQDAIFEKIFHVDSGRSEMINVIMHKFTILESFMIIITLISLAIVIVK